MIRHLRLFPLVLVALLAVRCTDTTVIGGDLLNGSQLPSQFTDSLELEFSTILSDTSQVANFNVVTGAFALGCLDDPIFGNTNASVGFSLIERDGSLDLSNATIDSVVLVLPLDTARQTGTITDPVSLQVLGATPGTINVDEAKTDLPLEDDGVVYGEITTVPGRTRTVVNFYSGDSLRIDSVSPQIRIPLNQQFIDAIRPAINIGQARDTIDAFQDSVFRANFAGLIIKATNCTGNLPAVSVIARDAPRFGVIFFYSVGDTLRQHTFSFFRSGQAASNFRPSFTHDYTGTLAARLLAGDADADSVSLVQSLDGLVTKVSFPDLSSLNGVAVNFAQLEIPIIRDGFSNPLFRIIPARRNSVGDFEPIGASSRDLDQPFQLVEGGFLRTVTAPSSSGEQEVEVYRYNLTTYFQRILEGERDQDIFLVPFGQVQLPGRSILVGPNPTGRPRARLRLSTTKLPQ